MGACFEALDEGVLAEASKSTGYFFAISISKEVRWYVKQFLRCVLLLHFPIIRRFPDHSIGNFFFTSGIKILSKKQLFPNGAIWKFLDDKEMKQKDTTLVVFAKPILSF